MPADTALTSSYEAIMNTIRAWPPKSRFALIQEVLATLTPEEPTPISRQPTLSQALGLLRRGSAAPTDAEVAALLEERRNERFER